MTLIQSCRLAALAWLVTGPAEGFSPSSCGVGRRRSFAARTRVFGLLDDMAVTDSVGEATTSSSNVEFEDLYHTLIFSGNTQQDIAKRLEACTQPDFLQYLIASVENSEDDEERQGLQELMNMIQQVQKDIQEKKAKEEAASVVVDEPAANEAEDLKPAQPLMSNADVLKRANQIDKAVAKAALSDDEKPSDFISDCREVVNLSGAFNSRGQMRVGGR